MVTRLAYIFLPISLLLPALSLAQKVARTSGLMVTLLLVGCTPIVTFQTPEVLMPNRAAIGMGAVSLWEEGEQFNYIPTSGWIRFGLSKGNEFGIRAGLTEGLSVDFKHSFLEEPFLVSGDIGLAFVGFDNENALIFIPQLLVGFPHLYGGLKLLLPTSERGWDRVAGPFIGIT